MVSVVGVDRVYVVVNSNLDTNAGLYRAKAHAAGTGE